MKVADEALISLSEACIAVGERPAEVQTWHRSRLFLRVINNSEHEAMVSIECSRELSPISKAITRLTIILLF